MNTEQSTVAQIRSELEKVRTTLLPGVDGFLHSLLSLLHEDRVEPATKTLETEHARLSELLLQALLRLDAISADGAWDDARAERKGAVKEVQALLDRLDDGWGKRPS